MNKDEIIESIEKYYKTPTKNMKSHILNGFINELEKNFYRGFGDFENCWTIDINDYMKIKNKHTEVK